MKWAAGGLAYAVTFLYLLTIVAGAVVALAFHVFLLVLLALFGWVIIKAFWPKSDQNGKDE